MHVSFLENSFFLHNDSQGAYCQMSPVMNFMSFQFIDGDLENYPTNLNDGFRDFEDLELSCFAPLICEAIDTHSFRLEHKLGANQKHQRQNQKSNFKLIFFQNYDLSID